MELKTASSLIHPRQWKVSRTLEVLIRSEDRVTEVDGHLFSAGFQGSLTGWISEDPSVDDLSLNHPAYSQLYFFLNKLTFPQHFILLLIKTFSSIYL